MPEITLIVAEQVVNAVELCRRVSCFSGGVDVDVGVKHFIADNTFDAEQLAVFADVFDVVADVVGGADGLALDLVDDLCACGCVFDIAVILSCVRVRELGIVESDGCDCRACVALNCCGQRGV